MAAPEVAAGGQDGERQEVEDGGDDAGQAGSADLRKADGPQQDDQLHPGEEGRRVEAEQEGEAPGGEAEEDGGGDAAGEEEERSGGSRG